MTPPPLWSRMTTWLAEAEVSLGDERLDARWVRLAASCHEGEGPSVAALAGQGGEADVRAAERFVTNPRIEVTDLREGLYALSLRALRERDVTSVIAGFDPSELGFSQQPQKKGRKQVGGHEKTLGYTWNNVALFDPSSQTLLGVIHQSLTTDGGPDDQDDLDYAPNVLDPALAASVAGNAHQQLSVYAKRVDQRVDPKVELTFVADTDFDDGLTLRQLQSELSARCHFVIRGDLQRVVQVRPAAWWPVHRTKPSDQHTLSRAKDDEDWTSFHLRELWPVIPVQDFRPLALDARGRVCAPGTKPARVAQLQIGAIPIRLAKRSERGRRLQMEESAVELHLVVVREKAPPAGKKGVEWLLLTDLPIDTLEQQVDVVERYLVRWRIEDFFRTTKEFLRLEESELHDPASTARWLFFMTLRAMVIDALRQDAGLIAGQPPTREQRKRLREGPEAVRREEEARRAKPGKKRPTREERVWMVLGLLARFGQWTGSYQGSLGNEVLLRGLRYFLHDLRGGRYLWLVAEKDVWP